MSDPAKYRTEEVEEWMKRDPLRLWLIASDLGIGTESAIKAIDDETKQKLLTQ
jgi:TPP-dependent pyruvate/acetoin dehydrogenase alpha subunit